MTISSYSSDVQASVQAKPLATAAIISGRNVNVGMQLILPVGQRFLVTADGG
jgi:hypothetical protein